MDRTDGPGSDERVKPKLPIPLRTMDATASDDLFNQFRKGIFGDIKPPVGLRQKPDRPRAVLLLEPHAQRRPLEARIPELLQSRRGRRSFQRFPPPPSKITVFIQLSQLSTTFSTRTRRARAESYCRRQLQPRHSRRNYSAYRRSDRSPCFSLRPQASTCRRSRHPPSSDKAPRARP